MTLRTVIVPDPGPGADWSTVVPGNYLYDVTGITANLDTFDPNVFTALDASPNHIDGTYNLPDITFAVDGLVAGDYCITVDKPDPLYAFSNVPSTGWITTADIWMVFWADLQPGHPLRYVLDFDTAPEELRFEVIESVVPGTWTVLFGWGFASPQNLSFIQIPLTTGRHSYAVRMQRGSGAGATIRFYVDGTPYNPIFQPTEDGPNFDATAANFCPSPLGPDTYDELAYGTGLPSDADFANLYAAAFVSFSGYEAAQLALGVTCEGYYHLNDTVPGTSRQVVLDITNGSNRLAAIDTGFAVFGQVGPFSYSWQPQQLMSSETAFGTLISIAVPRLLLPPGYTVGTRTLDLQAQDRWSNVTLWWSDDLQQALDPANAYAFPPGKFYTYQQVGMP